MISDSVSRGCCKLPSVNFPFVYMSLRVIVYFDPSLFHLGISHLFEDPRLLLWGDGI